MVSWWGLRCYLWPRTGKSPIVTLMWLPAIVFAAWPKIIISSSVLLPCPWNDTINTFMVWTLHPYRFVHWFAVSCVYLSSIWGHHNMMQLRESGCKHTFVPRSFSTKTNLEKQANICIIIGALTHHSRWCDFAIVWGHPEARKGECVKQLFVTPLVHLGITARCGAQAKGEWLQGSTTKGEVAVFYIIFNTRSGGHLWWLIPKTIRIGSSNTAPIFTIYWKLMCPYTMLPLW